MTELLVEVTQEELKAVGTGVHAKQLRKGISGAERLNARAIGSKILPTVIMYRVICTCLQLSQGCSRRAPLWPPFPLLVRLYAMLPIPRSAALRPVSTSSHCRYDAAI